MGACARVLLRSWPGLLLLVLFGLTDRRNMHPSAHMGPFMVGALVALIGMTFGFNAGYAINPARDLGPRLYTWVAGWGNDVWTAADSYWWVPIVGPLLGALQTAPAPARSSPARPRRYWSRARSSHGEVR